MRTPTGKASHLAHKYFALKNLVTHSLWWGTNCSSGTCNPSAFVGATGGNGSAVNSFDYPFPGQSGGRNNLRGPGYFDIDANLFKNFPIRERMKLQIGAQAYNLMNHPHFANPNGNISGGGFGMITGSVIQPTSPYGAFQGSAVSGRVLVVTGRFTF